MPAWRHHAIGVTIGLTILFSPLFLPTLFYVYSFLLAVFFIIAVEYYITTIIYSIIKSTQRR